MIQWLKRFYDTNGQMSANYNPVAARKVEMNLEFA